MSGAAPPADGGTARFQRRREAILDGAARLFNQQGLRGGTLADVARSVGLATNSITYYYRRKEDLAWACLQRSMQALGADARAAAATPGGLAARLHALCGQHLARLAAIAEGRHPELVQFTDVLSVGPPHDAAVRAAYTALFRQLRTVLEPVSGSADPPLPRDALNARAHLLLSTLSWARVWLQRYEPGDHGLLASRLADLLLTGVAAASAAPLAAAAQPGQTQTLTLPAEAIGAADDTGVAYLRAASRLVNEQGYHGASVDRIAAELQLTKGSFYHHHGTKEALIAAGFNRTFAVVRAAQSMALAAPGSGLQRLALVCRTLLDFQLGAQGPLLRLTAWNALPEALRLDAQRTMDRLGERFASFVIAGMADGSMRVVDPSVTAQVLNGMLNAAAEMERWVPGLHAGNAFELYAMPLFTGFLSSAAPDFVPDTAPVAAP
ncbi:MAG: TetR/AcrR family transcriptional regulator [Burkholderiaceae bacterium]|nr:TetR/AcrR family transcriptional regulator [Burkholderiaceae bacterium]